MKVNSTPPLNLRSQTLKINESGKKQAPIELLTDKNVPSINECRPGECAPINGGKCYPDN